MLTASASVRPTPCNTYEGVLRIHIGPETVVEIVSEPQTSALAASKAALTKMASEWGKRD